MSGTDATPSPPDPPAPARFDAVSAVCATITTLALASWAWLRFVQGAIGPEPPGMGATPSAVRLLDVETGEPVVFTRPRGRVAWLTFWSASSSSARSDLTALAKATKALRGRSRFLLAAAAVESDRPQLARDAREAAAPRLPVYLAPPETRRTFGADVPSGELPLHILLDDEGRVASVARGSGETTLRRLAEQVERWLDELEPLGRTRFAQVNGR